MQYKIDPSSYSNMFALPSCVADEHLRLAGSVQLRVIIWLFRHGDKCPVSAKDIGACLGLDESEVDDAMQFWVSNGLVINTDGGEMAYTPQIFSVVQKQQPEPEAEKKAPSRETKRTVEKITVNPPSHDQVARRLNESRELREVMQSAEVSLGSTLSANMQSVLVSLYDDYGLPPEVIAMLIGYCVKEGKATPVSIASLGRSWCENEIDTLEKAVEYTDAHTKVDRAWGDIHAHLGFKNPKPTKKQRDYMGDWLVKMGFSKGMILLAYEETLDHTDGSSNPFPYMNTVLSSWFENGIDSPEKVSAAKAEFNNRKNKGKTAAEKKKGKGNGKTPSFDIDRLKNDLKQGPPDIFSEGS